MGGFLFTAGKNILGYVAGRLLRPEQCVELLLDLADILFARTDSDVDNKVVDSIRTALGHDKKENK